MKRYPPREPYQPQKPKRNRFLIFVDQESIYSDYDALMDDFEEYCKENDIKLDEPEVPITQMSLQDILDLAPPGAKPADIYLSISDSRDREYVTYSYNYSPRNVELESRQFNDAMVYYNEQMVTYQEELAQYNLKKADYDEWLRTEKIKELEASLESLKKK